VVAATAGDVAMVGSAGLLDLTQCCQAKLGLGFWLNDSCSCSRTIKRSHAQSTDAACAPPGGLGRTKGAQEAPGLLGRVAQRRLPLSAPATTACAERGKEKPSNGRPSCAGLGPASRVLN
jgi:hypothetical protein